MLLLSASVDLVTAPVPVKLNSLAQLQERCADLCVSAGNYSLYVHDMIPSFWLSRSAGLGRQQ